VKTTISHNIPGMISVIKATERDYNSIASIGKISIAESHRDSCSAEDMNEFLEKDIHHFIIAIS
jgi:hypothetical protein